MIRIVLTSSKVMKQQQLLLSYFLTNIQSDQKLKLKVLEFNGEKKFFGGKMINTEKAKKKSSSYGI